MKISRQISTQIKGVAIIMMVFHHLFSYPSWWRTSFVPSFYSIVPIGSISEFGECMKMCIPIYAFITGYGLSCSFATKNYLEIYKWSIKKISFTLINYWVILGMVEAVILGCGHQAFSVGGIVANLLGLGELIIPFAWYISFYILILLVFPLLYGVVKQLEGNIQLGCCCIIYTGLCYVAYYFVVRWSVGSIVLSLIINFLMYSPYVVAGCVCKRVRLRDNTSLYYFICANNLLVWGLFIISIGLKVALHGSVKFDIVIVPCFVVSLACLLKNQKNMYASKCFSYLGKHSFNIWLFHCVPFIWRLPGNRMIQDIVYFPRSVLLILIWILLLTLPFSQITNWIVTGVGKAIKLNK